MHAIFITYILYTLTMPLAPVANDDYFEIALPFPQQDLKNAEFYNKQKNVIIFIPNAHAKRIEQDFAQGPVKHVSMKEITRGLVIKLIPSGSIDIQKEMKFITDKNPSIQIGAQKIEVIPDNIEEDFLQDHTADIIDKKPLPLAVHEPQVKFLPIALFLLFLLGVWVIWLRFYKKHTPLKNELIKIISLKSISLKHKIILLEACGERLLIATSDKDVTLLSHIDSDVLSKDDISVNTKKHNMDMADVSEDVQGLLRMRKKTSAKKFEVML